MGLIQDKLKEWKEKKNSLRDYEDFENFKEKFQAKKLSSDERELNRIIEERRQAIIKARLKSIRKRENEAFWSGRYKNPAYTKNVVANHKNLFSNNTNIFNRPESIKVYKVRRVV